MNTPVRTKASAVATLGIAVVIGKKNSESKNRKNLRIDRQDIGHP